MLKVANATETPLTSDPPKAEAAPLALESLDSTPLPCADVVTAALYELSAFLKEARAGQRQVRREAERTQIAEQRNEANALREKAAAILSSAVVAGGMLAASSAMHFAAYANRVTPEEWNSGKTENATERLFSAGGTTLEKSSDLANRVGDAAGTTHDAEGASARAAASSAQARAEDAKDQSADLADLVRKALDAVRAVLQAKNATMNAIIGRV
jgi:hypothetical protein